ncbi:MAG: hypothetical protein DRR19_24405 [Candidatus Parabeggiatoa sp. nov. 1]|nr:MAG: hypothetical protein DRR19_24405 [Gammaproteobacteria bacterium]
MVQYLNVISELLNEKRAMTVEQIKGFSKLPTGNDSGLKVKYWKRSLPIGRNSLVLVFPG